MKRIKFYLVALCISLTGIIFAAQTSLQERTDENWLQRSNEALAPLEEPGEEDARTPPGEPNWNTPIGDALPVLTVLSLLYLAASYRRRATSRKNP
jgi:hypothetical protein